MEEVNFPIETFEEENQTQESNLTTSSIDENVSNSMIKSIHYNTLDSLTITPKVKVIKIKKVPNFSGVIADSLIIKEMITSTYDDKLNITYLNIEGVNANIDDMNLSFEEEKMTEYEENATLSKVSYYAVIPNTMETFSLIYFNTQTENFEKISHPVNLKSEKISTQTDINPTKKNSYFFIQIILIVLIFIWFILFLLKRKTLYLVLIFMAIGAIVAFNFPKPERTLKKGSEIRLLPTPQSTVFMRVESDQKVQTLQKEKQFTKILINKHVGWVKNESIN